MVNHAINFSPFWYEKQSKIKIRYYDYRISANSFRGNYSFLNLALFTVTFDLYFINLNSCRGNYSREEAIQGRKLFAEIRYVFFFKNDLRFIVSQHLKKEPGGLNFGRSKRYK